MILIADSGSSTTEWYLIRKDSPGIHIQTEGMNPYFVTGERIESVLIKEVVPLVFPENISEVVFYGAGCGRSAKRDMIADILQDVFPSSAIEVNTDILGASRALFIRESGVAGILGTGSNLAVYNGHTIEYILPSLGYILGDEGSGASLGMTLLRCFIRKEIPSGLLERFDQRYHLEYGQIMDAVYHQPGPNRWMAAFTVFLKENVGHPFVNELVLNNFRYFVMKNLAPLVANHPLPVSFTGSVAYHFSDILRKAASDQGITISEITASPLEGLITYHYPREWR